MPPTLNLGDSDSEDDEGGPGGLSLPTPPPSGGGDPMLASMGPGGLKLPSMQDAPKADKNDFLLSQSGAFTVQDFQLRATTGLKAIGEETSSPDHAHPEELSTRAAAAVALNIGSLSELEMLHELGSGASGTVVKAKHVASGTMVAVKCVTILEKAKRDQVISEVRIMKKHTLGGTRTVGGIEGITRL